MAEGFPRPDWDVTVAGNYAYVAAGNNGLRIINISDLVAPTEAGFYFPPGSDGTYEVAITGDPALLADLNDGPIILHFLPLAEKVYLPSGGSNTNLSPLSRLQENISPISRKVGTQQSQRLRRSLKLDLSVNLRGIARVLPYLVWRSAE